MLGWHISVYRQRDGGRSPAAFESLKGTRVGVWQTGAVGLDWLTELVKAGKAVDLGGNGYPIRFTATAQVLQPRIIDEVPPQARSHWLHDPSDVLTERWEGRTVIDDGAAAQCSPEEWLLIEAWDES